MSYLIRRWNRARVIKVASPKNNNTCEECRVISYFFRLKTSAVNTRFEAVQKVPRGVQLIVD